MDIFDTPMDDILDEIESNLRIEATKIREANYENANLIISSQDRVADKFEAGAIKIQKGLEGFGSLFEWGFSELIWQAEQSREVLKNILSTLQAPLDTEAKELKKRAEIAYKGGLIDEALIEYLESEKKNRFDFDIHISLGFIYYKHKNNPSKALEYFEKAEKFASLKSRYYTSFALMCQGKIYYELGNFKKSYEALKKAIKIKPDFYELHYQYAQYCACLDKVDETIEHLRTAIIWGDRYYCLKADSEKDFNGMKKQLYSLFEELRKEASKKAKIAIDRAERKINKLRSYGVSDGAFSSARRYLNIAKKYFGKNAFLSYMNSIDVVKESEKSAIISSSSFIEKQISETNKRVDKLWEKEIKVGSSDIDVTYLYLLLMILPLSIPLIILVVGGYLYLDYGTLADVVGCISVYIILIVVFIMIIFLKFYKVKDIKSRINKEQDKLKILKDKYSKIEKLKLEIMPTLNEITSIDEPTQMHEERKNGLFK